METFGAYLKGRGVISSVQLEEATQSQVIFGGRLGTNLVELGYLKLTEIGRHLSDHLDVPVAPGEWLDCPEPDAIAKISRELAQKHIVLPLHLEKRSLHLAMSSPRDPVQLDDIAFATGLTVVPYVIPEIQLLAMLEHTYGIRREVRYIDLGREAARGRHVSPKAKSTHSRTGAEADTVADLDTVSLRQVASPALSRKNRSQDLIDETAFSALHHNASAPPKSQPAAPLPEIEARTVVEVPIGVVDIEHPTIVVPLRPSAVAALEAELLAAVDRDAVSGCALRLARCFCAAAALFVVRGGVVSGYRGDGDVVAEQISGILLPVESDCEITSPAKSRLAFRGRPPSSGLGARLLDALGRDDIAEVAIHPIQIRGQVVNLLYTDAGKSRLGETQFAAVAAVARLASSAYERLILEAKARVVTG